jgi:hypothetical protein
MGQIRVVQADDAPWKAFDGGGRDEHRRWVDASEFDPRGTMRLPHDGADGTMYLHEARIPPDTEVRPHAHRTAEIIYVLEGELVFGAHVLGPGASVHITGMTLYGFRSGPEGVRFLNFRAGEDRSFITRRRFLEERAALDGEPADGEATDTEATDTEATDREATDSEAVDAT